MGGSRLNKSQKDKLSGKIKSIGNIGLNNDSNAPIEDDARKNIGNQAMLEDQLEDDADKLNTAMIMDDHEAEELNNELDEMENPIVDDKLVENKKEEVGKLGEVVKEGGEVLNEKAKKLKKEGKNDEAENINPVAKQVQEINQSMQQVKKLNFTAVPKEKQKPSKWNRFWTKATTFFGGLAKGLINIVTAPVALYKFATSKGRLLKAAEKAIEKKEIIKNYEKIPGWEGAKFNRKNEETVDDLLGDARRVPAVWSYITAGEADKEQDGKKQILDPEVSIMVEQPKEGSNEHMTAREMGHAMIGITYSRYSNITKKNERYQLKYGFYPAGGMVRYGSAPMALRGAYLPGELKDDRYHPYHVSRRYPATMEKVGKILKASEEYAAGGYSYYKRNCTTFVKEMAVDVGQIASGGDSLFKETNVVYDPKSQFLKFGGQAIESYLNAGMRNELVKFSKQDDMTYQNAGNKRVNAVELLRYDVTSDNGISDRKGFIPAEVGEELRRGSGGGGGKIGSFNYTGALNTSELDEVKPFDLQQAVYQECASLKKDLDRVVKKENFATAPEDVKKFYNLLYEGGGAKDAITELVNKFGEKATELHLPIETTNMYEVLKGQDFIETRAKVKAGLDEIGTIYDKYFGIDERLNQKMMNLISMYQIALTIIDTQYEKFVQTGGYAEEDKDFGEAAERLNTKREVKLSRKEFSNEVTPSFLEGLSQACGGDVTKGLESHFRFNELNIKKDELKQEGKELSNSEKNELKKLTLIDTLAKEYEKSHRYMLEKNEYDRQDMDYAMRLRIKEEDSDISGEGITDYSAGTTYMFLIIQSIFGGLKKTFYEDCDNEKYADSFDKIRNGLDAEGVLRRNWIKDYIKKCATEKSEKFGQLMTSIYSFSDKKIDSAQFRFGDLFTAYYRNIVSKLSNDDAKGKLFSSMDEFIMIAIMEDLHDFIPLFIKTK